MKFYRDSDGVSGLNAEDAKEISQRKRAGQEGSHSAFLCENLCVLSGKKTVASATLPARNIEKPQN